MSEEQNQLVARAILDKYSSNTEVYFSSEILTAAGISEAVAIKLLEQFKSSVTESINKSTY